MRTLFAWRAYLWVLQTERHIKKLPHTDLPDFVPADESERHQQLLALQEQREHPLVHVLSVEHFVNARTK